MKKIPLLLTLTVLGTSLFSFNANALTITKNNEPEFIINRINIWKNHIELKYEDLDHSNEKFRIVNIVWGEGGETKIEYPQGSMTERWRVLWKGKPFWSHNVYNWYRPNLFKYSKYELIRPESNLADNPTNILYYAVTVVPPTDDPYPEEEFWSGKIDYSTCTKSVDYKEGVECRAELVSGKPVYIPYTESGKRLRPALKKPEQPSTPIVTPTTPVSTPTSGPTQPQQPAPSSPSATSVKSAQTTNSAPLNTLSHHQTSRKPISYTLALNNNSANSSSAPTAKNSKPQNSQKAKVKTKSKSKSKTKAYPSVPILGRKTKSLPAQIILLPPFAILTLLFLFFLCRKKDQKDQNSKED